MISRRSFLKAISASVALTTASRRLLSWADEAVEVPGKEGLIVRSARFLVLEMPPEFFDSWITPVPHFFVRNHMHEPNTLGPSEWRLTIGGEVEKPQTLNLTDLAKIEPHTVTNTLECAGNGRAFQQPHVPGVQWRRGAVGTGRFTGPRLRDLLQRAAVKSTGKHVMFPGLDEEFEGNFMKPGYRMPNQPIPPGGEVNPDDTHPITSLGVKSVLAGPSDGSVLKSRSVHIHGAAWAGEADIAGVEISTDSGDSWRPAQLGTEQAHYAWKLWSFVWRAPKPGEYTIRARATDR